MFISDKQRPDRSLLCEKSHYICESSARAAL